jgi:alanyl-tRNA synthetase
MVLGNIYKNKPVMILSCTKDIAGTGIDCGRLAREVGSIIKGGGGGRPDFAQLGGSDKEKLSEAMDFAVKKAAESLNPK